MLGRTIQAPVKAESLAGQPNSITVNGIAAGYYIVKVQAENVYKTAKVFLK